jgi:DNA-binding MarR family transcriptional regulator
MSPLTPRRRKYHLMLQAVKYGAEILTTFGEHAGTTIDGTRATLTQELAISTLAAERLLAGIRDRYDDRVWVVYLTPEGAALLAEWDREEWGEPEPIPVGVLHTTRSPARYGCGNDTEDTTDRAWRDGRF